MKEGYYTRADLCTTTRSIKIRESDAQIRLHIFCYSSLYAFMSFFLTGKVKYLFLIWRY